MGVGEGAGKATLGDRVPVGEAGDSRVPGPWWAEGFGVELQGPAVPQARVF